MIHIFAAEERDMYTLLHSKQSLIYTDVLYSPTVDLYQSYMYQRYSSEGAATLGSKSEMLV